MRSASVVAMSQPSPLTSWHALCLDANDQPRLAEFWATVIGRRPDSDDPTHLVGGTDAEQVWVDHVPEVEDPEISR